MLMNRRICLLLTILNVLLPGISFAQTSSCDVAELLTNLENGARLQRDAVTTGLQRFTRLSNRSTSQARRANKALEMAYHNALRSVIAIPFIIQSCAASSTCTKADFTGELTTFNNASTQLRDLGYQVADLLSARNRDPRSVATGKRLKKRVGALYTSNFNSASVLSATDCRGGRGNVATPTPAPTTTPAPVTPDQNALLRTMAGHWNHVAITASGFDHSVWGQKEQLGPVRSARAMAIVHIAIFDAVNAATGQRFEPWLLQETRAGASVDAAIAQSSYDALSKLFPSQASHFATELMNDLGKIPNGKAKEDGIYLGREAARLILKDRESDGADAPDQNEPYLFRQGVRFWALDPINPTQKPIGANWYKVKPFFLSHSALVRSKPFPEFNSDEYAEAYAEVKRLGGDGITTPTERTQDQTDAGIFWAYDGTPSLCAPPRLYNQIALHIANQRGMTDPAELTRMLALLNVSMSDAGVASWETKYFYNIARPITAIRQGEIDGNPSTIGDPSWTPLGAPATNLNGPNFTPPFPAYVSGHATFGGALFQTLRNVFGTDNIPFTFVSDELNGVTPGNDGVPRPKKPRTFRNLSEAEEENGQSRIYLGIHFKMDKVEGIKMGRTVANSIHLNRFRRR
jgi:hypothetical protein